MLAALIRFSLTQRLLLLVLTAMLVGAGVQAFRGLPIDAFPDVSTTQVKIILKAPGMTPEEVETRLAVPVEQEMLGIPHQRLLRSTSKYALTDITIDFEDGTDIYWARQQVGERLAAAQGNLPPGATGGMAPITTPLGEMFMFTIEGDLPLAEKRALLDWVIRPQLRTIPGVADVNSLGGEVRTFEVVPQPQSLAARGLALKDLQAVLESQQPQRRRRPPERRRGSAAGARRRGDSHGQRRKSHRFAGERRQRGARRRCRRSPFRRPHPLRRGDPQRPGRSGAGAGPRPARRQCAERRGRRQGAAGRDRADAAAGRHHRTFLRPQQSGRARRRHRRQGAARSHRPRRAAAPRLPRQPARGAGRRADAAAVGARHLHPDAHVRPVGQPDEPRRPRHRHRHAGRCGGGRRRKRRKPARRGAGKPADAAPDLPRRQRSRRAGDLGHRHHHHRLPAAAHPAGAGRQDVRAGRADHRLRAGLLAAAVADRGAGARLVPDQARRASRTVAGEKTGRHLRPRADLGPEPQPDLHDRRPDRAGRCRRRLPAARQELHADDGRRRPDHAAGKAAVDRPRPDHRHRQPRAESDSGKGAGSEGHRRPRRRRRTRPRPDGPQPDRHLHGAAAARHLAQRRPGLAGRPVARRDGRLPRHRLLLHAADRHARFGNADRRARRPGDQGLWPRPRDTEPSGRKRS